MSLRRGDAEFLHRDVLRRRRCAREGCIGGDGVDDDDDDNDRTILSRV